MLREIDHNVWVAEQPLRYFGLSIGTRMTVIRLPRQELVVISPIQISDAMVAQLNELGTVRHIVAPNLYHYLYVAAFKMVYPNAIFWATPGLTEKKPDLAVDQFLNEETGRPWDGIECLFFDGFCTTSLTGFDPLNEYVFFHSPSRTLILTDTAFNFDESSPRITQLVTRAFGGYKSLSPSLLERIATTDKARIRASVQKVLGWDFERVIVAHGSIVEIEGKTKFRQGYQDFLGQTIPR